MRVWAHLTGHQIDKPFGDSHAVFADALQIFQHKQQVGCPDDDAREKANLACELAVRDDLYAQVERRGPLAAVLARRGRLEEAERVATEAIELAAGSDMLGMQAGALLDLAGVLRLAGRDGEAALLARQALALAERKGHLVAAAQARELLTTAQPGGTAAP